MKKFGLFFVMAATFVSTASAFADPVYITHNDPRSRIRQQEALIIEAQNGIQAENSMIGQLQLDLATERQNAEGLEARYNRYANKAQDMLQGCPYSQDREECEALANAERDLGEKMRLAAIASREQISSLEDSIREHRTKLKVLVFQRDEARERKERIEEELRGPKHVTVTVTPTYPAPRPVIIVHPAH